MVGISIVDSSHHAARELVDRGYDLKEQTCLILERSDVVLHCTSHQVQAHTVDIY